jgi:hypothetical protein
MPSSLEDRVGALEEKVANLEENLRRHIATSCETFEELARTLLEARNEDCELPPGCETVLTITEEEESAE